MTNQIGTLNEKPLHAALKDWYAQPNDQFEVPLNRFVIDIVRGDLLIEIQTRSFAAMKRKLLKLTPDYSVHLVHPIATQKWIIKIDDDGTENDRRKSPKQGSVEQVFTELVSFPKLIKNPNFSLEVLLIHEEEIRKFVGRKKAWRKRGWRTEERRLVDVVDRARFDSPADLAGLIPESLAEPFTTADLASAIKKPRRLAQQMVYCLREMEAIQSVGHQKRSILYTRCL